MERDHFAFQPIGITIISTHTLTWSVTSVTEREVRENEISTHTLTWSVTEIMPKNIQNLFISTHTLTWSVTIHDSPAIYSIY